MSKLKAKGPCFLAALLIAAILAAALPAVAEADGGYAEAYAGIIEAHADEINAYWMGGIWNTSPVTPQTVALADVMGDEVPELIFLGVDLEGAPSTVNLYIYTWRDGAPQEALCYRNWEIQNQEIGMGAIYQVAGERDLYSVATGTVGGAHRWYVEEDDPWTLKEDSAVSEGPATYTVNGRSVDEDTYVRAFDLFPRTPSRVLIVTYIDESMMGERWDGREHLVDAMQMEPEAMTASEAVELLRGGAVEAPEAEAAPEQSAPAEADGNHAEAYAAYASLLPRYRQAIQLYWQGGGSWDTGNYVPTAEPRAIVLADVVGDDTPELIFIAREEGDGEFYSEADLYVYGWWDGEVQLVLMRPCIDSIAADVGVLCLYQVEGDRDLYAAVNAQNIGWYHWFSDDGLTLREESLVETFDDEPVFLVNGQEVSEDQYGQLTTLFPHDSENPLLYTVYQDPDGYYSLDGREMIGVVGLDAPAMTYDEAIAFLENP